MTRRMMLIGAFAVSIVAVSVSLAPIAPASANAQTVAPQPMPIHSLTSVAFHAVAAGF